MNTDIKEFLFEATKDHPKLAKQEILSLFEVKKVLEDKLNSNGNIFLIDGIKYNKKILNRLAYTNRVFEVLVKSKSIPLLKKEMKNFDWNKIYKESFAVDLDIDSKNNVKEFAGIIFDRINNPKVNLSNPKTFIQISKFGNEYLASKLLWTNKKEFLKRKPHMKPAHHPTSLDPKLAIACINLCGLREEKEEKTTRKRNNKLTIFDPFCGSGGFLVEAGLMGFNVAGFDLEDDMLERSRTNLNHYLNKNDLNKHKVKFNLYKRDSTNIKSYEDISFDAVVTDLPYGRASKVHSKSKLKLYNDFINILKKLKKIKQKEAEQNEHKRDKQHKKEGKSSLKFLIIIPSDIDKQIFNKLKKVKRDFSIKFKYSFYLHRTLSRIIYLLE